MFNQRSLARVDNSVKDLRHGNAVGVPRLGKETVATSDLTFQTMCQL